MTDISVWIIIDQIQTGMILLCLVIIKRIFWRDIMIAGHKIIGESAECTVL